MYSFHWWHLGPSVDGPVWFCHFLKPELLGGAGCLSPLSILLVMAEVTPETIKSQWSPLYGVLAVSSTLYSNPRG